MAAHDPAEHAPQADGPLIAGRATLEPAPHVEQQLTAVRDLYELVRRLEAAHPDAPRIGRALRLAQDIARFGQEASLAFPSGALASVRRAASRMGRGAAISAGPAQDANGPWRVQQHAFGLLGPNGPLPLHLTEYIWQRIKHHADHSLAAFLDVFHHRMFSFFYRAWVDANPAVSHDRPEHDRFGVYLGALMGVGSPALRDRDELGDDARRYYAGRFSDSVSNPEGLCALIEDHFGVPAHLEEFVGEWVDIPESSLWRLQDPGLGIAALGGQLGLSTQLGRRSWLQQGKFRVVLGPLTRHQFNRVAPGGSDLRALTALISGYSGTDLRWDLRLRLRPDAVPGLQLGTAKLGQTAWLWSTGDEPQDDVIYEPLEAQAKRA